ncbi:MAG: exonuclease SbcCD subunit D [bacterium]|jgi:exonuclease SbcD
MRILHTSDWHLGRLFHGVHLTEDQAYVLEQVVDAAGSASPDVVLISGDVYDRAVPPAEAITLLDDVISRMVLGLRIPVIMIAGNHDSPDRLAFGSRLMQERGFHVAGPFAGSVRPVVLEDGTGKVYFYPLPFAEPSVMQEKLGDPGLKDHDSAMRVATAAIREHHPGGSRSVLLAHAFVVGGTESESERPLSVGGAGTVKASVFDGFDYVALGHLHRPQEIGGTEKPGAAAIQYAGSLMKYSFSEAAHQKCMKLVEMDEKGKCGIENIPLRPRRDVRSIEGYLEGLLSEGTSSPHREDYLSVGLLDEGAIYDAMGRLREVYPNVLEIRPRFPELDGRTEGPRFDHRKHSESALFEAFYKQATGEDLSGEQARAFSSIVDKLRREEREAGS